MAQQLRAGRAANTRICRIHPHKRFTNQRIFKSKCRFTLPAIKVLAGYLDEYLVEEDDSGWIISKLDQVEIFVEYLGTNGFQTLIADRHGVSQQAVSNIVTRCLEAITDPDIVRHFIFFPVDDPDWLRSTARDFSREGGLPNVIGAVDGSHVHITTPANSRGEYRCRKGFPSLNVGVCIDSWHRVLWVNGRYPGSCHDSFILEQSSIRRLLDGMQSPHGYAVIGDSGYANGRRLMTSIRRPITREQEDFNKLLACARVSIEQFFGKIKKRFNILESKLRLSPEKSVKVVLACCVLWNFGMEYGIGVPKRRGDVKNILTIPPVCRDPRAAIIAQL